MNPSSNDLPDVAALLKELESSAAWQELRAANAASTSAPAASAVLRYVSPAGPSNLEPQPATSDVTVPAASTALAGPSTALPEIAGTSVADLLSQLSSSARLVDQLPFTSKNRQKFTFVQSLPVLSELGEDPSFVATIKKMKDDQNQLERRLWMDREAIYAKYQDKIKMITDAFNKELFRFDHERVLPAWDGLVSRQQSELGQMTVPTMFVTTNVEDRKKQQQVISVLETITGPNARIV
ncbi:hypothetical protein BJ912DRAFT_939441 [Pholiota molesta]|nr:hypothetical protein BJ912DRAFT_939441 [Pholiota molesta]